MNENRFVIERSKRPIERKVHLEHHSAGVYVMIDGKYVLSLDDGCDVIGRCSNAAEATGFRDAGDGKCMFEGE
jgi:hypothetical protein